MGDMADDARAREEECELDLLAEALKNQLAPDDEFDTVDEMDPVANEAAPVQVQDAMRPKPHRGRYSIPNPDGGKKRSWQRVTNFTKLSANTYLLELWKQRNIIKGVALLMQAGKVTAADLAAKDVKLDKTWLNHVADAAQDAAEAYKMADEGTALHKSTELVDHADGDLSKAPAQHRIKIRMYRDALAAHGIRIVPGMIERTTVSLRYNVAGTFDRIGQLLDGTFVIVDLKTGDSIDFAASEIASQMQSYEDGVNTHGVWDGQKFDQRIKVRTDFALVVHLPSTRDEVAIVKVDLAYGRQINETNLMVRKAHQVKAQDVYSSFSAASYGVTEDELNQHWLEQLNAAHSYPQLVSVANRAKYFGQWNERLGRQARLIATELKTAAEGMGS